MKKLKLFVFGLLLMFVALVNVNAQEVSDGTEKNLRQCIKNTTDGVCILTDDVTISNDDLTLNKDITIDLNTHTLTLSEDNELWVKKGANVIIKNGTVVQGSDGYSAIVIIYGHVTTSNLIVNVTANVDEDDSVPSAFWLEGKDMEKGASLTVSADTKIIAPNGSGIGVPDGGLPVSATLNGTWETKYPVIYGTEDPDDDSTFDQASFTFNGGSYTTEDSTLSIYKKGNWIINDGTFTSKTDNVIKVTDPVTDEISLKINNGVFETKAPGKNTIDAGTLTNFIFGGKFNSDVSAYLAAGLIQDVYGTVATRASLKPDIPTQSDTTTDKTEEENNTPIAPESEKTTGNSTTDVKNPNTSDNFYSLVSMLTVSAAGLFIAFKKITLN